MDARLRRELGPWRAGLLALAVNGLLGLVVGPHAAQAGPALGVDAPIVLQVDARQAPSKIFHAQLVIPVRSGKLTLVYPKWIPGEHAPTGPIEEVVNLHMTAGGKEVAWRRDDVDMYTFHVDVPRGAPTLEIQFDYLAMGRGVANSGPSTTQALAVLNWNQVVLYPQGMPARAVMVQPSLLVPAGWQFGTSLEVAKMQGAQIEFVPVSLEMLVDSPVLAGEHFRVLPLTEGTPPAVQLDMACDSEAGLRMRPETEAGFRRMVTEADALFGVRHFRRYHLLLALSDRTGSGGVEHHESSDNRVRERTWLDPDLMLRYSGLLPHEFIHSWNGKYRRPVGLAQADFQAPLRGEMLWVYEGLTTYLDWVLTARCGLQTVQQALDGLAESASVLDERPGRTWRSLRDTAIGAQLVFGAPGVGTEWRRGSDYYEEGALIWLEADVLIRQQSGGARSLDDFCKRFFGGPGGEARVVPFTVEEVIADLQAIAPYDWRAFFETRLDSKSPRAPLGGITAAGWQLNYSDSLSAAERLLEQSRESMDLRRSIGLLLGDDGMVRDLVPTSAAAHAGITPGMHLVAVDGRAWNPTRLRDAIQDRKQRSTPIELLVQDGDSYRTCALDYHDGERAPHLQRDATRPDLLAEILRARAVEPVSRR